MRLLSYQFQPEEEYVELVAFSDLHYGSRNFIEKKAMAQRAYVLAHPDRKVIDLGDSTENALRSSPGASIYNQTCPPSEQRSWVREFYDPMRDRFLGIVSGNHEDRSEREADTACDETLVAFLRCPWIKWEAVLSITVGDSKRGQTYTIFTRHAFSNSSKPGTILGSMIAKSRSIQGCDVYLGGHNHMFLSQPMPAFVPDPRHGKVRQIEQHFALGDSFMSYDQSYAEQYGWPVPSPGQVSLKLWKSRHQVSVERLLY